MLKRS
jgi:hypothetical protein